MKFRIVIIIMLFVIILTFAYQNLENVNISFVIWSIKMPLSLTIFLAFVIGLLAGGISIFLVRKMKKDKDAEA